MKKLFLITDGYPYIENEVPFIQPEFEALSKQYNITVVSCGRQKKNSEKRIRDFIGNNTPIFWYQVHSKSFIQCVRSILDCCSISFLIELARIIKSGQDILKKIWLSYLFLTQSKDFYRYLVHSNIIKKNQKAIYYTYWFSYAAYAGIILKKHRCKNIELVSRIHGYDLYNDQAILSYQPYKNQMDRRVDKLLFVCDHGMGYFKDNFAYNKESKKYFVNRLGVYEQIGESELVDVVERERSTPFVLVSCSSIYPLKRVNLIIDALSCIQCTNIRWIHFGGGVDLEKMKGYAQKVLGEMNNIVYEFTGNIPNEQVLEYYKVNRPHCIINVSESEGCSVSLQEALAFGMPIIATAVGGNSEIVKENGVLLPGNPSVKQVAEAMEKVVHLETENYKTMQIESYFLWKSKFNREENLKLLISILNCE